MNDPVIFMAKGTKLHPRLRDTNLVTRYVLPEGSCVIPKKSAYMGDETWLHSRKLYAESLGYTRDV